MNWDRFQTHGLAPDKAFEMLCNQLFENWCKETYNEKLYCFSPVNGAGGDGGVESYAELTDKSIIGLQAKWFRSSMGDSQFSQIESSIRTSIQVRPNILTYIVCVPRDLTSKTGRKTKTESDRWEELILSLKKEYPSVVVELWNDYRITKEMQRPSSSGINRYWFENTELDYSKFEYSFSKAKASWLSTKYVPDLNIIGQIHKVLTNFVGDIDSRRELAISFDRIIRHCNSLIDNAIILFDICKDESSELFKIIDRTREKAILLREECKSVHSWIVNESTIFPSINPKAFNISFDSIIEEIRTCKMAAKLHFHLSGITKELRFLSEMNFQILLNTVEECCEQNSLLFLGNPGTGKTQGVSAFSEYLLKKQFHIPIIVQARSIPSNYGWKDIIESALSLADNWDEDELWQALISGVNRNKIQSPYVQYDISIVPKVLIIADGIDESDDIQKWVERIKEANYISSHYPQIKFCFTSRPAVFASERNLTKTKKLSDSGDAPAFKLFDSYLTAYNITVQKCQWLKFALNTPLALKLFCEIHANRDVSVSTIAEVSMEQLWRKKIDKIQTEYNRAKGLSNRNQSIFESIVAISNCFLTQRSLERYELIDEISAKVKVDSTNAERLLEYLEEYGVLSSFCKKGEGIDADKYIYYPGIQGYLDYASAANIIDKFKKASLIDFRRCGEVNINTLYNLSIIAIQREKELLVCNESLREIVDAFIIEELFFYSLQYADFDTALKHKDKCLEIMRTDADSLVLLTNKLILPLARIDHHPLGVSLLDNYLNEFNSPAKRDIVWSLPEYLRKSEGKTWWKTERVTVIDNAEYDLIEDDPFLGLPTIYAWMLSNVDNSIREECREKLMFWAKKVPEEYFNLFLHFSENNDPQLRSDLFSILMCLVYDYNNDDFTCKVSQWIQSNILSPEKIDSNRSISIRYYSIAIVKKAKSLGIYKESEVNGFLPPYNAKNSFIKLNKDALNGTRMGGYSAIDYDLARYVLIDHICDPFNIWGSRQLECFIHKHYADSTVYNGVTPEQFVLSAAYAYILEKGWHEREFYNKTSPNGLFEGVDCSIRSSYHSADHGAQSRVMTVCEKYVWQARHEICGFLCDRLLFGDDQQQITDYSLLDDFLIPILSIQQTKTSIPNDDAMWFVPEPKMVIIDEKLESRESISSFIRNTPDIDWHKWILLDNINGMFSVPNENLTALWMYSCFHGLSGIETCLFMNSIVIPSKEVRLFAELIRCKDLSKKVCNPSKWDGYVETSCYITPKEVCWFPWKKHYDSDLTEEFPELSIQSAINRCCYSSRKREEIHYTIPAAPLRAAWGIVDTDGHIYYNAYRQAVCEYYTVGEKWDVAQEYLVTSADNIKSLNNNGLSLIWILLELKRETGAAREKYGKFYVEKRQYYIAYLKENELIVEKIESEFSDGNIQ